MITAGLSGAISQLTSSLHPDVPSGSSVEWLTSLLGGLSTPRGVMTPLPSRANGLIVSERALSVKRQQRGNNSDGQSVLLVGRPIMTTVRFRVQSLSNNVRVKEKEGQATILKLQV